MKINFTQVKLNFTQLKFKFTQMKIKFTQTKMKFTQVKINFTKVLDLSKMYNDIGPVLGKNVHRKKNTMKTTDMFNIIFKI